MDRLRFLMYQMHENRVKIGLWTFGVFFGVLMLIGFAVTPGDGVTARAAAKGLLAALITAGVVFPTQWWVKKNMVISPGKMRLVNAVALLITYNLVAKPLIAFFVG